MKNRLLIACVVIVLGILAFGTISASAATEGIYTYSVSGGEATITACYEYASGDITIPSTLGGYPVTSIGDYAFYNCKKLTSITIPDSVTSIGSSAFFDCASLTSITIPNSVTSIGDHAFLICTSLTSIEIPDSVTSIGDYAFSDCTSLESVTIGSSVTSIGDYAFSDCTSLESVTIGSSVTSIGDYAFSGCTSLTSVNITDIAAWCNISFSNYSSNPLYYAKKLYLNGELVTDLVIPEGVTSIGDYAFYYFTSLTSVTIPDSVTRIDDEAFFNCTSLTSVNITDIAAWCNISFSNYSSNPLYYAKKLYLNGELVSDLVIPECVTSIGKWAFYKCTSLTSITIPDSVTSIGDSAFHGCTSLTSVTIPDSVTSIGSSAFYGCTNLTSVNITDIAAWCNISFSNYSSNPLYYAKKLYLNGELVTDLVIPEGVTSIGDYAFYYFTSLTSVTIPDSVTSIGYSAFRDCESLTSITIPDSVTSIGSSAFRDCESLTSITMPDSVTSIGDDAFRYCESLTSVNITDIAAWCNISFSNHISNPLYYAKKLYLNGELVTDLVIPEGVTSIGDYAFYYFTSLTSVTIPDSVTSIGYSAFYNRTKLKTVYYSGTADKWNKISIGSENSSLTSANRIYVVNVKIVYENGEEVSFTHTNGKAIDDSYITKKQYYTPVFYKDENRTEKISVDTPISESTTLYLGYEPILYTHIFRDENGAVIKTESVPYGTVITPPEAPEKEATDDFSYTFAGWKDFTSGMTQTDVELVFVAQYDAVHNNLEQFKMVCDDSVEIGANIDLTASFATNISAQYIYMTVGIPDGFAVRELTPIDFAEISLDIEEHKNGYTYFTYLGIYDYNGAEIPKNAKVLPFKIEIGVSKDVIAGEYPIIVSEATLINNEGSFIPFENMRGVTITVEPKLAESITISGPSSIDKPTSFTATVYPDYTSNKEVLWSVSDETVASIDENGLLTPLKNGTVIVSATAADGSGCVASKSVEIIKYAEITSLSSDVGVWDKAFSPDVYEYTIAVFGDVSSITLTPTFKGGVLRPNGTGLWISGTKKSFALGEDTTTITLVRQNVTDNADSTYTINVVKAKSEFDGAQIRTDDPQGLRFVFSIPRAIYDMLEHPKSPDDKGIGFGSVVMPKKYLGDNELTKETEVTLNGRVYKSKIAPAVNLFDVTEDEVKFTACLIEIPEKNYEEEYVAVPYMTYMENGEEITIYGEKTEGVTVFTIAEMAYADSTVSDDVKKYLFDNILTVVRPDKYHKDESYDYRIVLSAKTIADKDGKEKNIYTVLNITNAATAGDIETVKGLAAPAGGAFVLMNEEGKIAKEASIGTTYVEDKMFKATFNGGYEEANKFLEIGDGNTYVITDDTTFLYYTSTSVYQMADEDILTVEDNSYEGLEEATSFTLYIVADEIDDKNTDDSIKTVKTIVVTK